MNAWVAVQALRKALTEGFGRGRKTGMRRPPDLMVLHADAFAKVKQCQSSLELLRDLEPRQRADGLLPELIGVQPYKSIEFDEKVDWMIERGFLETAPEYAKAVRAG